MSSPLFREINSDLVCRTNSTCGTNLDSACRMDSACGANLDSACRTDSACGTNLDSACRTDSACGTNLDSTCRTDSAWGFYSRMRTGPELFNMKLICSRRNLNLQSSVKEAFRNSLYQLPRVIGLKIFFSTIWGKEEMTRWWLVCSFVRRAKNPIIDKEQ